MFVTWRTVPSFPNYEVSSFGKLRHKRTGRLRPGTDNGSALIVSLYDRWTGRMTSRNIGALVLEAYAGLPPGGAECSHLDGDYTNNRKDNLTWESRTKNCARKRAHGTHGVALTEPEVSEVRRRLATGESQRSIATAFGINQSNVSRINRGEAWRNAE